MDSLGMPIKFVEITKLIGIMTRSGLDSLTNIPSVIIDWECLKINPFTPELKKYILPTF